MFWGDRKETVSQWKLKGLMFCLQLLYNFVINHFHSFNNGFSWIGVWAVTGVFLSLMQLELVLAWMFCELMMVCGSILGFLNIVLVAWSTFKNLCIRFAYILVPVCPLVDTTNIITSIWQKKYPKFMKYPIDEVLNVRCCCCQDTLIMADILMTVQCCHFICGECACKFIRMWSDNDKTNRKCPMCRNLLIDQIFAKSIQNNMTSMSQSTIFIWIPTFIYIKKKLEQLIVKSLEEKKLMTPFDFVFY